MDLNMKQVELVKELKESGKTTHQIARLLGLTNVKIIRINQFIKSSNISDRDAEIRRRILSGETFQSIGDSFGLSRERIRFIGQKLGLEKRRNIQQEEAKKRESVKIDESKRRKEEHEKMICDLRILIEVKGLSQRESARTLNLGRGKCFHLCKTHNITSHHGNFKRPKPPYNTKS